MFQFTFLLWPQALDFVVCEKDVFWPVKIGLLLMAENFP